MDKVKGSLLIYGIAISIMLITFMIIPDQIKQVINNLDWDFFWQGISIIASLIWIGITLYIVIDEGKMCYVIVFIITQTTTIGIIIAFWCDLPNFNTHIINISQAVFMIFTACIIGMGEEW